MPRGVYARKSAQSAGALKKAKPKAKAKPAVKKAKKPAPKAAVKAAPKAPKSSQPAVQLVAPAFLVEPGFYKNKRVAVDDLDGDNLKAYARSLGITQRDVDGLTPDRLRQNCKARIANNMAED